MNFIVDCKSTSSLVVVHYLVMAHTKNTERKNTKGLPRARFSRIATRAEERNNFYRLTLQLPPQGASDWTSITPSDVTSPELERTVERLNLEHLDVTMLELVVGSTRETHSPPQMELNQLDRRSDQQPEEMCEAEVSSTTWSHLPVPYARRLFKKLNTPQCYCPGGLWPCRARASLHLLLLLWSAQGLSFACSVRRWLREEESRSLSLLPPCWI